MQKALAACILVIFLLSLGCQQSGQVSTGSSPTVESAKETATEEQAAIGEDVVVIDNIDGWNHATKPVFQEYGFAITRVELRTEKTYPVFFVNPSKYGNRLDDYQFLSDVAEKNAFWDFEIVSPDGLFAEVRCNREKKRVVWTKTVSGIKEFGSYSPEEAAEKATELVVKKLKLTYNKKTDMYAQEGVAYEVMLSGGGFDEQGRYEIRVCPDYYPLSVLNYCYVDLANETVDVQ